MVSISVGQKSIEQLIIVLYIFIIIYEGRKVSTCVHDVGRLFILDSTLILQPHPEPPSTRKVIKCIHGVHYLPSAIRAIVQDDVKIRFILECYGCVPRAQLQHTKYAGCAVNSSQVFTWPFTMATSSQILADKSSAVNGCISFRNQGRVGQTYRLFNDFLSTVEAIYFRIRHGIKITVFIYKKYVTA